MDATDLRRRREQWELAAARERAERRRAARLSPDEALEASLELIAVADVLNRPDPVRDRRVQDARIAWNRVRAALR